MVEPTKTPRSSAKADSGTRAWLVLMKAHRTLSRHARRSIEALDLGLSDFAILELLLHKGPQKVNEIGRKVELTSGAITSAVDRLEARRLVARGFDASDRRSRIVRLTVQGKAHISGAFAVHEAAMERAASGLSKSERATLIQLLKKLGTSAEAELDREPRLETA
jgi:MarR family 2-MHQ and catechol resistance regulon transcriptional repressor